MLAVEDAIDGLRWAESIGGLPELIRRSEANLSAVVDWQSKSLWCSFLARTQEIRSNTSICLQITDPRVTALEAEHQAIIARDIAGLLEKEGVAFDIGSYRDAPPGLRIWGGATVETSDIKAVLTWLDYAWGRYSRLYIYASYKFPLRLEVVVCTTLEVVRI
jgi:phosphoserine aminotransferase